jgi:LacI family transcriptional regulator
VAIIFIPLKKKPKKPVTVVDVASKTGLSASTVSAVLSNRHVERRISPRSVQKVMAAARRLGYVPDIAARRLRSQRENRRQVVIGILTTFEAPVLLVSQALHALRDLVDNPELPATETYIVGIEMFHAGKLRELSGFVDGNRFNGVIITNTTPADDEFLTATPLPFPAVMLGRSIPGYCCVSEQPHLLGAEAARILLAAGRKRLAVLCPKLLTQATAGRLSAFLDEAARVTGHPPDKIVSDSLDEEGGCHAMAGYLSAGGQCDGLFSVTDSLAVGAYPSIWRTGRRIPEDIAIVGVGDHEAGPYLIPPLTTFRTAQDELNRLAAETLLGLLNGQKPRSLPIKIPITACLRESTGHRGDFPT